MAASRDLAADTTQAPRPAGHGPARTRYPPLVLVLDGLLPVQPRTLASWFILGDAHANARAAATGTGSLGRPAQMRHGGHTAYGLLPAACGVRRAACGTRHTAHASRWHGPPPAGMGPPLAWTDRWHGPLAWPAESNRRVSHVDLAAELPHSVAVNKRHASAGTHHAPLSRLFRREGPFGDGGALLPKLPLCAAIPIQGKGFHQQTSDITTMSIAAWRPRAPSPRACTRTTRPITPPFLSNTSPAADQPLARRRHGIPMPGRPMATASGSRRRRAGKPPPPGRGRRGGGGHCRPHPRAGPRAGSALERRRMRQARPSSPRATLPS